LKEEVGKKVKKMNKEKREVRSTLSEKIKRTHSEWWQRSQKDLISLGNVSGRK
jgi:hypothetical protein